MTDLLIRNIDPELKQRIADSAKRHNRSLSDEVAASLAENYKPARRTGLGTALVELFRDCPIPNDFDMEIHELVGEPIDFSKR